LFLVAWLLNDVGNLLVSISIYNILNTYTTAIGIFLQSHQYGDAPHYSSADGHNHHRDHDRDHSSHLCHGYEIHHHCYYCHLHQPSHYCLCHHHPLKYNNFSSYCSYCYFYYCLYCLFEYSIQLYWFTDLFQIASLYSDARVDYLCCDYHLQSLDNMSYHPAYHYSFLWCTR